MIHCVSLISSVSYLKKFTMNVQVVLTLFFSILSIFDENVNESYCGIFFSTMVLVRNYLNIILYYSRTLGSDSSLNCFCQMKPCLTHNVLKISDHRKLFQLRLTTLTVRTYVFIKVVWFNLLAITVSNNLFKLRNNNLLKIKIVEVN